MRTHSRHRHRRGFGLLEVILVFAVIIGATAAIFGVYLPARQRADAQHDVDLVRTLSANISQIYGQGDTTGLAFASWTAAPALGMNQFCPRDPNWGGPPICASALTGQPIGITDRGICTNMGMTCTGFGWSFVFQDLTTEQCLNMLSSPTGAMAYEVAKSGQGLTFLKVQGSSYADIISLCENGGQNGQPLDQLELDFSNQPGNAAQMGW